MSLIDRVSRTLDRAIYTFSFHLISSILLIVLYLVNIRTLRNLVLLLVYEHIIPIT
jgi:hypothetical protein